MTADKKPFTIQAYSKGELVLIYKITRATFRRWLSQVDGLGDYVGQKYTPSQVKKIVDHVGLPYTDC